jgi:hypothetical protein
MNADPMSRLEHQVEDKRVAVKQLDRLEAIEELNQSKRDDYSLSKKARLAFRVRTPQPSGQHHLCLR